MSINLPRRPKVRDLLAYLRRSGWRPIRCRGSHEQWVSPEGETVTLVIHHANAEVAPCVLRAVRRRLAFC